MAKVARWPSVNSHQSCVFSKSSVIFRSIFRYGPRFSQTSIENKKFFSFSKRTKKKLIPIHCTLYHYRHTWCHLNLSDASAHSSPLIWEQTSSFSIILATVRCNALIFGLLRFDTYAILIRSFKKTFSFRLFLGLYFYFECYFSPKIRILHRTYPVKYVKLYIFSHFIFYWKWHLWHSQTHSHTQMKIIFFCPSSFCSYYFSFLLLELRFYVCVFLFQLETFRKLYRKL